MRKTDKVDEIRLNKTEYDICSLWMTATPSREPFFMLVSTCEKRKMRW